MRIRDGAVQACQFELAERQRDVQDIEIMISEFSHLAQELEQQAGIEEERAGVSDPSHFSYPPIAKAARQRAHNLRTSVATLTAQIETARARATEAQDALEKAGGMAERSTGGAGQMAFMGRDARMA